MAITRALMASLLMFPTVLKLMESTNNFFVQKKFSKTLISKFAIDTIN